jgi:hypothetical protein
MLYRTGGGNDNDLQRLYIIGCLTMTLRAWERGHKVKFGLCKRIVTDDSCNVFRLPAHSRSVCTLQEEQEETRPSVSFISPFPFGNLHLPKIPPTHLPFSLLACFGVVSFSDTMSVCGTDGARSEDSDHDHFSGLRETCLSRRVLDPAT